MFNVGDRVILRASDMMAAEEGATAIVRSAFIYEKSIYIEWERDNELCGEQLDGGYEARRFALASSDDNEYEEIIRANEIMESVS